MDSSSTVFQMMWEHLPTSSDHQMLNGGIWATLHQLQCLPVNNSNGGGVGGNMQSELVRAVVVVVLSEMVCADCC